MLYILYVLYYNTIYGIFILYISRVVDEYIRAAMDLAEDSKKLHSNKSHPAWEYGFFQRSVFVKHLDYWRPWMFNLRDSDHMLLNRVRCIISTLKGTGSMGMKPDRAIFEMSLGRFPELASVTHVNNDGKEITTWPRPSWQARPEEIKFIDSVLPNYVRLPQVFFDGKFPRFFTDTLTIGHANLFFSGFGQIIVYLCPSIGESQKKALIALIDATAHVLMPVFFERELPDLQLQMARAQTLCEMYLPLSFNTMANHAFLEVFLPERGRIARAGSCLHSHMVVFERFNKLLRALMTQFKTPAKHLMLSVLRLNMVEMERVRQPPGYFPTVPEKSSILGALRSGAIDEKAGPDYIRVESVLRGLGDTVTRHLTLTQSAALHDFFLFDRPVYRRAHQKLQGTHI